MLLYITAEDVFGSGSPERRGPRPLHRIPETLAGLYDLGLRHHVREAAAFWPADGGFEAVPDWKLDRLAIRTALFLRERLGIEPGRRVGLVGRLGWLWPAVDFAAMGFGMVPVGVPHDLADEAMAAVLRQAEPGAVLATEAESAARLAALRREGRLGSAVVVGEGLADSDGQLPLARLLELGSILDTAERAQAFRAVSRQVSPESEALWHAERGGPARLSHREAMARVAPALQDRPAQGGDVAYVAGPRVGLEERLAVAAFVGDGQTAVALGRDGRSADDLSELRPHRVVGSAHWLGEVCNGNGRRWPAGLDRLWARRRLREALGGRLRRVEPSHPLDERTLRALALAGVDVTGPERRP